jgi:hypothetical protein
MPESQKTKTEQTTEVYEKPDFEALARQKEELFKKIVDKSLGGALEQKILLVDLISNFSIKDGFEMAKRVGLEPGHYRTILRQVPTVVKIKNSILLFQIL